MYMQGTKIGKIFIGGLGSETSTASLRKYFERFGELCDCVIMTDKNTNRSRGFGFITLNDSSRVEEILRAQPHIIDGKQVDCKIAIPKDSIGNIGNDINLTPEQQNSGLFNNRKIFVGGLHPNLRENEMRLYFEKFGEIEQCVIMHDKPTGKSRGFGFVIFAQESSADMVMQIKNKHSIMGKWVDCKRAMPKELIGKDGKPIQQENRSSINNSNSNPSNKGNFSNFGNQGNQSNLNNYNPIINPNFNHNLNNNFNGEFDNRQYDNSAMNDFNQNPSNSNINPKPGLNQNYVVNNYYINQPINIQPRDKPALNNDNLSYYANSNSNNMNNTGIPYVNINNSNSYNPLPNGYNQEQYDYNPSINNKNLYNLNPALNNFNVNNNDNYYKPKYESSLFQQKEKISLFSKPDSDNKNYKTNKDLSLFTSSGNNSSRLHYEGSNSSNANYITKGGVYENNSSIFDLNSEHEFNNKNAYHQNRIEEESKIDQNISSFYSTNFIPKNFKENSSFSNKNTSTDEKSNIQSSSTNNFSYSIFNSNNNSNSPSSQLQDPSLYNLINNLDKGKHNKQNSNNMSSYFYYKLFDYNGEDLSRFNQNTYKNVSKVELFKEDEEEKKKYELMKDFECDTASYMSMETEDKERFVESYIGPQKNKKPINIERNFKPY